ncbi:hypothetical protein RI367_001902 [Sorochytrium milnesiophthora]
MTATASTKVLPKRNVKKSNACPPCPVLLKTHVLLRVFSHLSSQALLRASQTCGSWRRAIEAHPELWRTAFVRQHGKPKLLANVYAVSDYKRILMHKMFYEQSEWHGLAKNKPRKLVALRNDFIAPTKVHVGPAVVAYACRVRDRKKKTMHKHDYICSCCYPSDIDDYDDMYDYRDVEHLEHDYLCIQSTTKKDHAEFVLPVRNETKAVTDRTGAVLYDEEQMVDGTADNIEVGNKFVAVQTGGHIRVYPATLHTRPFRVDIKHAAPFDVLIGLTFSQDVLVATWAMRDSCRELAPSVDQQVSVLRVYDFRGFWPATGTDRFTVFPHTVIPFRELFTPYRGYLSATADFISHLTDGLAQQHNRQVLADSARTPSVKVVLANTLGTVKTPAGHHKVVFAFDGRLELIGVRKYDRPSRPDSKIHYDAPKPYGWISIHGHYLIEHAGSQDDATRWAQPRLCMHLDDSHTAPLPDKDIITTVQLSNLARVIDAFAAIPFAAPETIARMPITKQPVLLRWLHLAGHHLVLQEAADVGNAIKAFDLHTWELVASRKLKPDAVAATGLQVEAGQIVHMQLGQQGVYMIRDTDNRRHQLEFIPYAVQAPQRTPQVKTGHRSHQP